MLAAVAAGASHPAVAGLLGLGAAAVAGGVVAMAWNVHAGQIRLASLLARRQFIVTGQAGAEGSAAEVAGAVLNGAEMAGLAAGAGKAAGGGHAPGAGLAAGVGLAAGGGPAAPVVIEGPDVVVAGDQVRYRVRQAGGSQVVSWAAGGGPLSQCPDPAHGDELLLVADRPGDLTVSVRVREGIAERRATKSVTAVPDVAAGPPPFPLRLFLHGWGLVVVAVMVTGFAAALDALGSLTSSDFIALVAPLAALLAVIAVARGAGEAGSRPGNGQGSVRPRP